MSNKSLIQKQNTQFLKSSKKESDFRKNCIATPPVFVTGLNVKGTNNIVIINYLDGVNNNQSSDLIASVALPSHLVDELYDALKYIISEREENNKKED